MSASASPLAGLFAACDMFGIVLEPTSDGRLAIDGPRTVLIPEIIDILQAHKREILLVLSAERDLDVCEAATMQIPAAPTGLPPNAVCGCGSTIWKDVPIHDGQSTRRDCARCRRFICFPVWHEILDKTPSSP